MHVNVNANFLLVFCTHKLLSIALLPCSRLCIRCVCSFASVCLLKRTRPPQLDLNCWIWGRSRNTSPVSFFWMCAGSDVRLTEPVRAEATSFLWCCRRIWAESCCVFSITACTAKLLGKYLPNIAVFFLMDLQICPAANQREVAVQLVCVCDSYTVSITVPSGRVTFYLCNPTFSHPCLILTKSPRTSDEFYQMLLV